MESLVGSIVFSLEFVEVKIAAVYSSKFLVFQTFSRNLQKATENVSVVEKRFGGYEMW